MSVVEEPEEPGLRFYPPDEAWVIDGLVVDTSVLSLLFDLRPNPLGDRYRALMADRPVLVAFQSVMECATEPSEPTGATSTVGAAAWSHASWPGGRREA